MVSILRELAPLRQFFLMLCATSFLAAQQQPPNSVVKCNVNEVLVPVVVRDAQGKPVGNLTKDDFQILDDGKPQVISGFTVMERATVPPNPIASTSIPTSSSNRAPPPSPAQRFVVFLFDNLNLSIQDLSLAQKAASKLLETPLAASDMVSVLSSSGTDSGLTRDHAKLQQAILNIKSNDIYQSNPQSCPKVDYYTADLILNKRDGIALEAAIEDTISCAQLPPQAKGAATVMVEQAAERAVAVGQEDYRTELDYIRKVISKMGTLPGERILILVSPGFLTPSGEAMELESQVLDAAARGNVIINAIDSRGLYTTNLKASERGTSSPFSSMVQDRQRPVSMAADEDVMVHLAEGSGGMYLHGQNDLEAGLTRLFAVPEYSYLLTFSVAKPNGSYHKLKIKVNHHDGQIVQARHGYVAPKSWACMALDTPAVSRQSSAPSDASINQSLSAKPDPIEVQPKLPKMPPEESSPSVSRLPELFKIHNFASCSLTDLRKTVSQLAGLKPSADEEGLPTLLERIGEETLDIARRTPNLISHETVDREYGGSLTRENFSYLVLPHIHPGGAIAFDEFRIDRANEEKAKTGQLQMLDLKGPPVAQGFATMWVYFEPLNQPESSFRYLGEQKMSGRRTLVLAFAQKPESVQSPATFHFEDKALPIFMQGVAWVDASTFKIVRLRTDLLFPIEAVDMRQLTADIVFKPTSIEELNLPLWMPRQVSVTWNLGGHITREKHRYSDYRLFRASSRILLSP